MSTNVSNATVIDESNSDGNELVCQKDNSSLALEGFVEIFSADGSSSGACRQYANRLDYVEKGSFFTIDMSSTIECASSCTERINCNGFE